MLVAIYLGAIVAANLVTATWGPGASIVNAFLLIGLDLSARDRLHEVWKGHLARNMAALIAAGSALSWLLNRDAGPIAVASFAAFAAAATVDALVYQQLWRWPRLYRMNGSNVLSALTDSLVFPSLAFGGFMPLVTLGQWAAKVGGGFVWSLVLGRR
jgi:uncharacterized PurR-regulated membrane protein YhhQ (DUF165 family)